MNKEERERLGPVVAFTVQVLKELKKKGFQYVRVDAFTQDKRPDYMEPRYFLLVPIRELSKEREKKGIYEHIDSSILESWASSPGEGIEVFVLRQ